MNSPAELAGFLRHPLPQLRVAGARHEEARDLRQSEPGCLRATDEREPVDHVVNFAGLHTVSPEQARAGARRLTAASVGEPEKVAEVTDRVVATDAGEMSVRVYRPAAGRTLPVTVIFHGGGYVLGDLDSHDGLARSPVNGSQSVVVSVDYPLAPEHKFPVPVDAGYAATKWVADNTDELGADPARLAVAGDSAGGNLAAVVALKESSTADVWPPRAFRSA